MRFQVEGVLKMYLVSQDPSTGSTQREIINEKYFIHTEQLRLPKRHCKQLGTINLYRTTMQNIKGNFRFRYRQV